MGRDICQGLFVGVDEMNRREVRMHAGEVRASPADMENGELRFDGYAAMFNSWSQNLGGFREQIAPGAFSKAIVSDDVRALYNHDPNYVLGRNKAGTLTLSEDDKGLHFDVRAPDTGWARDLHESVKRGDVNQCSFGFEVIEDDWRTVNGLDERTLKEVRLFDVSIVTYPAYEATSANARSAQDVYSEHESRKSEEQRQPSGVVNVMLELLKLKEKESKQKCYGQDD